MKNNIYLVILLGGLLQALSCKKETQPQTPQVQKSVSLENGVLSFSVNGQLVDAVIDTLFNTITVTIPATFNQHTLTVNFTLASQASATINNAAIISGASLDLTVPLTFKVSSGYRSSAFKIIAQNEMGYFGLPGTITAQNSLNRDYEYYFDQFDNSPYQLINCGPASTSMAIKWADSTFTGTPAAARNTFPSAFGWWDTGQIQGYLYDNGLNDVIDTITDLNQLVKNSIDNNNAVILNPDMNYIPYNENFNQHVSKFYPTTPGWGHYFLVKGYLEIGNTFYLQIDDPYSNGERYTTIGAGQLKGENRYYNSDDVEVATKNWWHFAIIVAPKGQKVVAATHLTLNSVGKPKTIPLGYGR